MKRTILTRFCSDFLLIISRQREITCVEIFATETESSYISYKFHFISFLQKKLLHPLFTVTYDKMHIGYISFIKCASRCSDFNSDVIESHYKTIHSFTWELIEIVR